MTTMFRRCSTPIPLLTVIVTAMLIWSACSSVEQSGSGETEGFIVTGTMHLTGVGPGCWQLISEDGETYEIAGLNTSVLHREGLHVQIRVRLLRGVGSICSVGEFVELLEIITKQE